LITLFFILKNIIKQNKRKQKKTTENKTNMALITDHRFTKEYLQKVLSTEEIVGLLNDLKKMINHIEPDSDNEKKFKEYIICFSVRLGHLVAYTEDETLYLLFHRITLDLKDFIVWSGLKHYLNLGSMTYDEPLLVLEGHIIKNPNPYISIHI